MIAIFRNRAGELRNGWWILLFYLALAALLVPTTLFATQHEMQVAIPVQALLVIAATALCLLARRERPSAVLGTFANWRHGPATGLLLGLAIWGVSALVLWLSGTVTWHWNGTDALIAGLLDCVAVAVVEELLFRGFPFQRLIVGIGAWPAQLAMAGYFTLTHSSGLADAGDLQWLATTNIFLAGLLFGACYLRTKSLALPIALHFTLNFVQGPLLGFEVSGNASASLLTPTSVGAYWWTGGAFGLEASLPGTIAILAALLLMLGLRRQLGPSTPLPKANRSLPQ